MNKLKEKYKYIFDTLPYLLKIIYKKKPIYIFYMCIQIVVKVIQNIIIILMPKYIVEGFLNNVSYKEMILYVVILVVGNSMANSINSIFTLKVEIIDDWFERYFDESFCINCLKMPYENTENSQKLDEISQAKDGLRWSGGIGCILDSMKEMIAAVFTMFSIGALVIAKAPWLMIIVLLTVWIKAIINSKNIVETRKYNDSLSGLNRRMGYSMHEVSNYSYGKDIRLYNAKEVLLQRSKEVNDENASAMKKFALKLRKLRSLDILAENFIMSIQYLYIGILTLLKILDIGEFVMLIGSVSVMTSSLEKFFEEYQYLNANTEYFYRYMQFELEETYDEKGTQKIKESICHEIRFVDVSFKYPNSDNYVLRNINLSINECDKIALVGLNGEGKTTLIKLLCRLYKPTKGKILLDNIDIFAYEKTEYNDFFSVVFQDFKLFSSTIKENIVFDNVDYDNEKLNEIISRMYMLNKIASLKNEINTEIHKSFDESGFEPSGGESQKIAIIRALSKNANFMILDEPTAALDPMSENLLYKEINYALDDKTVIFISHRLAACFFCKQIVVISGGTIKELGTHEELMKIGDGIYKRMFEIQAEHYN